MKNHKEDPKVLGAALRNIIAREAPNPPPPIFVVPCTVMTTASGLTSFPYFDRIKEKNIFNGMHTFLVTVHLQNNSSLSFHIDTYSDSPVSETKQQTNSLLSEAEKQSSLLIPATK